MLLIEAEDSWEELGAQELPPLRAGAEETGQALHLKRKHQGTSGSQQGWEGSPVAGVTWKGLDNSQERGQIRGSQCYPRP
jgi:hypothetical protein